MSSRKESLRDKVGTLSARGVSYFFAGSLSGAFDAARDLAAQVAEYHDQLVKVLGESDNPAREPNDVFVLLRKADPTAVPYLYLACGSADRFLKINQPARIDVVILGVTNHPA